MADFLSQDEVDALLKGVTGESEAETAEEEPKSSVQSYNLGNQERIVRGRMPTMELINERFSRNLRIALFNFVHRSIEVSSGTVKVQKYSEFVRNLVVPTNLNLITAKPLRGTALMVFDPNLVFLTVDNLFGGDGRFHTRVEGRDFTPTEQRIIQGLLEVVMREYEKAWAPVYKLELEFVRSEMNSQFANIATPSEIVVSVAYTLEFGNAQVDIHTCFPYSMLEPIRELLYSTMQGDHLTTDKRWINLLSKQLQGAEIELVVNLGTAKVNLSDIVDMKVGDLIPLNIADRVKVTVDGVEVIEGYYGVQRGQYALKVDRFLSQQDVDMEQNRGVNKNGG